MIKSEPFQCLKVLETTQVKGMKYASMETNYESLKKLIFCTQPARRI